MASLDLSILIILFGALLLYFGRIIGETKVEKYDQLGYYEEGLIFSAVFIYIPSIIAYYIYIKSLLVVSSFELIFIQIVLLICLSWNLILIAIPRSSAAAGTRHSNCNHIGARSHEMPRSSAAIGSFTSNGYFIKFELLNDPELIKKAEEKREQIKLEDSFIGRIIKKNESVDMIKLFNLFYYKIPIKIIGSKLSLFIFSFITIILNIQLYKSSDLLIFGFSLLLAFFILTMVALAYGYGNAYYPPGKIYMVDGTIIEGKILKFGEYVSILNDDKKLFINNDKINYVEESKFKKKE